ncbi:MAG: glutamate racemase [Tissierellia bacterium]|nr:glutamate racemase [Tissierellia bacterium]
MIKKVGILDSGLGGLTVLQELLEKCPRGEYIYLADNQYLPYGEKTTEELRERGKLICRFFREKKIDLLVLACNTITATALDVFEKELQIPVYGVIEYGAKDALTRSKNKKIALLATERTVKSKAYDRYLKKSLEFMAIPCPELVFYAEEGIIEGPELEKSIAKSMEPIFQKNMDTVIWGCTHYPVLKKVFDQLGPKIQYIDPAKATVEAVARKITPSDEGKVDFYTTKIDKEYPRIIHALFGISGIRMKKIKI